MRLKEVAQVTFLAALPIFALELIAHYRVYKRKLRAAEDLRKRTTKQTETQENIDSDDDVSLVASSSAGESDADNNENTGPVTTVKRGKKGKVKDQKNSIETSIKIVKIRQKTQQIRFSHEVSNFMKKKPNPNFFVLILTITKSMKLYFSRPTVNARLAKIIARWKSLTKQVRKSFRFFLFFGFHTLSFQFLFSNFSTPFFHLLNSDCQKRACTESHEEDSSIGSLARYIMLARESIDMCQYSVTNQFLTEAILRRHKLGVKVRVITDHQGANILSSQLEEFYKAGVQIRPHRGNGLMHNKFLVIDNVIVATGSFNFTNQAMMENYREGRLELI